MSAAEHKLVALDRSGAEAEIRRRREAALKKGENTNFSFLVGADADSAEVIFILFLLLGNNMNVFLQLMHCCKSDLLMASDYFGGLMRNLQPGQPPVLITRVQPHIFKMMIRQIFIYF